MAKRTENPDEIVLVQVKPGATVRYRDHAYGARATLQVRRGDLSQVQGDFYELNRYEVPDVATIPE